MYYVNNSAAETILLPVSKAFFTPAAGNEWTM
jgi:hypothetical protein